MAINKKICLLGSAAFGKTCLVRRFVYDQFEEPYRPTSGVRVLRKRLSVTARQGIADLVLLIWDMAGGRPGGDFTSYLHGADGAVLLCPMNDPASLQTLAPLLARLHSVQAGAQAIIAATKSDLPGVQIAHADLTDCARRLRVPFRIVSAKNGDGVHALFAQLAQMAADSAPQQ